MIQLDLSPDRGKLRNFGFIACAAFLMLAAYATWRQSLFGITLGGATDTLVTVFSAVAIVSLGFSLVWPTGNRALYVVLTLVTFPIGIVVSNVMLVILFYGLFTPIALVFRLMGRDALNRRFEPDLESYWVPYPQRKDPSHYFRQF